jgi:hypothetical protein
LLHSECEGLLGAPDFKVLVSELWIGLAREPTKH